MPTLYGINLSLHIVAGAVSLLTVAIPLLVKKGGRLHRRAGWTFTIAMAVVAVTGLILAGFWFAMPLQVKPMPPEATVEALARRARGLRLTAPFFVLLSCMTGYAMWMGIATARRIDARWPRGLFVTAILACALGVFAIGVGYGQWVFVIFGAVGSVASARDLWRLTDPAPTGQERVITHLRAMLGGATAAFTAFTVQTAGRLTDDPWLTVVVWTAPMILGATTTRLFVRRLRRPATGGFTA